MASMELSLSSFVYFNFPLAEAIKRTAAAGYKGIDIWGGRPHAYRRDLSDQELTALCRQIDEEGLAVASFIPAQFRYPTSLCSPSDKVRQDSIAYIQDSIQIAAALGAPIVSVCPGHTLYGQTAADGLGRLTDSLNAVTEFAARHKIRIAIEPADKYETDLVCTCLDALSIVQSLGHLNLGVLLDNGHAYVVGEDVPATIGILKDHLFHVHIDDNFGQRDQHFVPGDGSFDFVPMLRALDQVGYQGYLAAELEWGYTIDPDPPVRLTVERMKGIMQQAFE
jgi:fructoselysine 3-epimerase